MHEDTTPIVRNQPAPGDLKRGDYVFASKWSDCDPGDPWEVGFVSLVGDDYVVLSGPRHWRKAMRITQEQGHRICAEYPAMEGMPLDYNAIAKVFGVTPPGDLEYASWVSTAGVPVTPPNQEGRT